MLVVSVQAGVELVDVVADGFTDGGELAFGDSEGFDEGAHPGQPSLEVFPLGRVLAAGGRPVAAGFLLVT